MIQNAIVIGSGGSGSIEVITPTATVLSNSNKTITLSGISSKPYGALATYSTVQSVAIIVDSNGNYLVNFCGKGATNYPITEFTYDKNASTLTITVSGTDVLNISNKSYWHVLKEGSI